MADWYVLDLDRDPTPGDPDQTRALASWHREEADRIARNVALLRGVASRDSELQLGGDYAPKFRETLQELPPQLDKLRVAYEGCFHALSAYERVLREAKEITATQLARGRNAYHDREQALRQIRALLPAERQLGLGSGLGLNSFVIDGLTLGLDEATRAQVRAAAARAREAERERQAARRIALDAARLREEAADRCAREIENALRDSGIQNKPWYRKAWDFVTTPFRSWDNFVETCRVVTATTAVAAVFVSGPVGWTLLGAAVVAGGVNATATVMRFRQGRASFGELALDLAGVVPGARLLSGAGLAARLSGLTSGAQRTVVAGLSRTRAGVTSIRQGLADVRGRAVEFTRKLLRGDPVDVATGEVVLPQTDVDLAGVLPVRLVRTHLSGYRVGRSFGPSWSSTLDQRVEVEAHRVFFAAEDGMLLVYPKPGEGEAVLPEEGPRWPLSVSPSGGYEIRVPGRGIVLRFGASLPDEPSVHPLIAISDRNGNTIELRRSEDGTVTDIVHPAYHIVVDSADGLVVRLRLRDVAGVEHPLATYRYDHRDRLVEVRDSGRRVLRYEYDHSGRLTAWEDSNGTTYRYGYDGRGRCITATGSDGCLAATFAYGDDATVVTDSLGHQRTYRINDAAQVVAEIDPVGGVHTTAWDRYDRVTARTDPLGRTTAYEYDDAGHLTGITYPDGGRVTIAVNGQGQPVSITDESGAVWRYRYDDPGNLVEVTDPLGARTQYAYDSRGHLVSVTDALGNTVRIETDAAGLATAVVDATGGVTRYERDPFGRPTTITDASGRVIRLTWTPEGRLTSLVTADGARQEWHYDGEGNCVEQVDAAGNTTRVRFTHFDLPEVWTGPDGSQLTFRYDTELRPVMVVNSAGLTWTFEYDPAGNLVRERDFHGRTTTYAYDVAGQMIARTNALGETTTFVWNARGKLVESITGDAVTRYSYDPVGRLV
ncbi:MAG: type IV secretion protein Rhs, partial [Dactylosporangium sp.]|nr:type IV secretion protein Rhs [Dactylosporangium sp.]